MAGFYDPYSNLGANGQVTGSPLAGVDPNNPANQAFNFSQYPTDPNAGRTMDPSQAVPNTGINGGGGFTYSGGPDAGVNVPSGTGAPTTTAPIPPAATGGTQSPQQYYQSLFPPGSRVTPQDLLAHKDDLAAHGITLINNAEGMPGKISLADGSAFDVIQGAGTGNGISQWNQIAGPGGVPTGGGTLGSIGGTNQFGQSSGFMTAPIGLFTPPTAQDALNSPGLQFALDEANRMGQNSGAAHGTLLNGRFQQALNASNIQNALGGYVNNVFNPALQTYNANYQTQTGNEDRPFQKYSTLATLGSNAAAAS